jgi:hypothetical protein
MENITKKKKNFFDISRNLHTFVLSLIETVQKDEKEKKQQTNVESAFLKDIK